MHVMHHQKLLTNKILGLCLLACSLVCLKQLVTGVTGENSDGARLHGYGVPRRQWFSVLSSAALTSVASVRRVGGFSSEDAKCYYRAGHYGVGTETQDAETRHGHPWSSKTTDSCSEFPREQEAQRTSTLGRWFRCFADLS